MIEMTTQTNNIDPVEQELRNILPLEFMISLPTPPYTSDMNIVEKLKVTQKALKRSIELHERITSLMNAYYLGKLFDDSEEISEKFRRKNKAKRHYAIMAEHVFDIFEPDPLQIYQTLTLNVQQVKKFKKSKILRLRSIVETNVQISFAGAQDLGEEIVTLENDHTTA